ncbi:MAG TPA: ABC transporter permease [Tenuifilaceae bacterium]|nr:ABC transporter permease [Tenuifilaceae bacterium]HRX66724.1 ABC transporter permease [Tenuifilaceae bacterium]
MFTNFLVSAYRNLMRNRTFTIVNILGLSIGILSSILVLLYVTDELAFDKHHSKHHRIYRIISNFHINGKQDLFAVSAHSLAPTLKQEFTDVEEFVRFIPTDNFFFRYNGADFNEEEFFFADSSMFKIFDHEFLLGNPEDALNNPYSIVITETLAKRIFGNTNPIGQVLQGMQNEPFTITAVIKDVPRRSHFRFSALVSTATIREQIGIERFNDNTSASFWNVNTYSYILLRKGGSTESILSNFEPFNEKYIVPVGKAINGEFTPIFQPLKETHFTKIEGLQGDFPVGNHSYLFIFSFVALFILIIACINYMNMATARSTKRAREVGIRKVIGATQGQIVRQFISESFLLSIIAALIALASSALIMPWFNHLADKQILVCELFKPSYLLGIIFITLFVGLVAGSYPAFYLSSFSPVVVLKGIMNKAKGKVGLRKLLVVFQFTISILMIIATLVVSQQQSYIRNKDMGFDKENLLIVSDLDTIIGKRVNSFKQELLRNPNILGVAGSQQVLGISNSKIVSRIEQDGEMKEVALNLIGCDFDYLKLLGVKIDQGRHFDPTMNTDSTQAFIINETFAKFYGWSDEPMGKRIQFGLRLDGTVRNDGRVIGVARDFHFTSIHNPIEPFMFIISPREPNVLTIKIKPGTVNETLDFVKKKFDEFKATRDLNYYFLEQELEDLYRAEQKLGWLFRVFSVVTIFISCLGLLGLSSFITEQRTKEIGIRKVLGGTSVNIIILLTKQFLSLVLAANIFAWPLAYFAMRRWLQGFSYRIAFAQSPFSWQTLLPMLFSGILALLIAFITVGLLSWRAAEANPAGSLKYE